MATIFSFRKPKNKPEISGKQKKPEVPDNLYYVCTKCKNSCLSQDFVENFNVCLSCNFHARISARQRILKICENFVEQNSSLRSKNLLNFPEYDEKLEKAEKNSGETESVICGICQIGGIDCAVFAMEHKFMMGSMGLVTGEKIAALFDKAAELKIPVVGFILSGGARMQEGMISLIQMAKTSAAVMRHSNLGLLYIAVLTDPTTGGVSASFASQADIILAEPQATIGFAGARVIEGTMRQKLPSGFQTAEFMLEKGFIDKVVHRRDLKDVLSKILKMHKGKDL